MRKLIIASTAVLALGAAACTESAADKSAEQQADALESQAAATSNEAQETALNEKADAVEQQAGNADGGMTTGNMPGTTETPQTQPPAQ